MKKELKLKAIELRKEKRSYREIAELLHVSKSTVSYWLHGIDWSRAIQGQLTERTKLISQKRLIHLNALKKAKWKKIYEEAEAEAIREFESLKGGILFATGLSLYWGEGDKNFSNGQVRVSNVDERLLVTFRLFLKNCCGVTEEKIRAYILLYPDLKEKICLEYWSKNIGIPEDRFFGASLIQGKHKKNRLSYGVCSIQVSDKRLKKKVLTWIDLFAKMF